MYEHQEYPKWRYHATEKALIVRDPEHEDEAAHGDAGWVDHPSMLVAEVVELVPPKKGRK